MSHEEKHNLDNLSNEIVDGKEVMGGLGVSFGNGNEILVDISGPAGGSFAVPNIIDYHENENIQNTNVISMGNVGNTKDTDVISSGLDISDF